MRNYYAALGLVASAILSFPSQAQDLRDVIAAAQDKDAALQSASANRDAARENIGIAVSRLLPQLNYQDSRQQLHQTTTQATSAGPQARDFDGASVSRQLSVRQGVVRPRDVAGYYAGDAQAQYGAHKYDSALSDLWSRSVSAWLDVLAARTMVDAYQQTLKAVTEAAQQEVKRFDRGDGTRDVRAEAQAQLVQARAMLVDARLALKARERAYQLLTNLNPITLEKKRLPNESAVLLTESQKDELWAMVSSAAPELLAAQSVEDMNRYRMYQAASDHLPTVDVIASATRAQNDSTNTLGASYNSRQVGIQVVVPLISGGGIEAARRQSVSTYQASVADRESMLAKLDNQFSSDWASQAGLLERAQAARSLLDASKDQRRGIEMGLARGMRNWGDLSNAELLVARRASDLINLQLTLFKTQARLLSLTSVQTPIWDAWVKSLDVASGQ
jgi:outer membrane protein TolC